MDSGYPTQNFDGPAFLKHYTTPPSVSFDSSDAEEAGSVELKVVTWTSTFTGNDKTCVALRDE